MTPKLHYRNNMPRKYQRKFGAPARAQWGEDDLRQAVTRIKDGNIGIREASRYYGIPESTLRRRKMSGKVVKSPLGPGGVLGQDNEKRLVLHIQRLANMGFAPDQRTVRRLAFQFAENLQLKHPFNQRNRAAGYDWMLSFLERNPNLSVRQSQGLSVARGQGLCREEVGRFFTLLEEIMDKYNLHGKPANIFNMDESGIQLINKPGKVVTAKGSKNVNVLTSGEKGETITVIACNNAEGRFLPPVLVLKGVNKRRDICDGLPPGSDVFMNAKNGYVNTELFMKWFKEFFIPRKSPGVNVLILDGHVSHCNSLELLDLADQNDVVLICLPSHTTHALQPLDRAFFGPLKKYFNQETQAAMKTEGKGGISRSKLGYLFCAAWKKAASVGNAVNGFKGCGIFPLNPNAIPDHMFSVADAMANANSSSQCSSVPPSTSSQCSSIQPSTSSQCSSVQPSTSSQCSSVQPSTSSQCSSVQPSTSTIFTVPRFPKRNSVPTTSAQPSPTKLLNELSPLPNLSRDSGCKTNKRKQCALELTSPDNIQKRRQQQVNKKIKESMKTQKNNGRKLKTSKSKDVRREEFSSYDGSQGIKHPVSQDSNKCAECWENYFLTKKKDDWIKCSKCNEWLHETCTIYQSMCNNCGRCEIRKKHNR